MLLVRPSLKRAMPNRDLYRACLFLSCGRLTVITETVCLCRSDDTDRRRSVDNNLRRRVDADLQRSVGNDPNMLLSIGVGR